MEYEKSAEVIVGSTTGTKGPNLELRESGFDRERAGGVAIETEMC